METENIPFNKILRRETRDIHSVSDALVNAKLAIYKDVWAEGLLIFYEIFRFLEQAMSANKESNLCKMYVNGMERTSAFEEDLKFYLGDDWKKNYTVRESVAKYLSHLKELESTNTDLLIAYVYHLYMGLLSGGQILRKKREIGKRLLVNSKDSNTKGNAVTDFGNLNIHDLKQKIVDNVNSIADSLDEDTKFKIIVESRMVFKLNNEIVKSIEGTNVILLKKVFIFSVIVLIIFMLWKLV
ncbi:heme oxygenase isoform X2 [Rhodnius prolixus]|uniref:heme oxygenase isoform X2 n=1 Tax=Rhodnius prolixus TaxID=13249 RepID=UPI003D18BBD5